MSAADDDWRLQGQEQYLLGATLQWRAWWTNRPPDSGGPWDHDHCDFCMRRIAASPVPSDDPPTLLAGYCTPDGRNWICEECFDDFRDRFGWSVAPRETA